jgi:phosphatidylserine/phosphatidylglycerophosphate/cardiolipin synthase-like enzyme
VFRQSRACHSLRAGRKSRKDRRELDRYCTPRNRHGGLCTDRLAGDPSPHARRRSRRQSGIYLDGAQLAEREPAKVFQDLAETPTVEIRTKRDHGAPMHLKSYQIDGRLLRTGAANFSASGLKRQDNDLIVTYTAAEGAAKCGSELIVPRVTTRSQAALPFDRMGDPYLSQSQNPTCLALHGVRTKENSLFRDLDVRHDASAICARAPYPICMFRELVPVNSQHSAELRDLHMPILR